MLGEIYIQDLKLRDQKIFNHLNVSGELKRFINVREMFVEFDTEIYTEESILNIPLVATVLPLAWLSGSDIFVDTLDRGFKESMDHLQKVFKRILPLPPFTTEIHAGKLIENRIEPEDPERRTGLLFSGGVDSTYSMITNMEKKPRLVMYWGLEGPPYPVYREYWKMVNSTFNEYAEKNDLTFNLIKTNALKILNRRKMEHNYHRELYYGSIWVRLQESLVLLCLAAPFSMNRFDKFLIAASMYKGSPSNIDVNRPHSAQPIIDESISWAGLKVKHDGFIPRYQKIKAIAKHLHENSLILRVCLARPGDQTTPEKMNCGNCSKCYRTIMQLVQAGIDPREVGLKVNETTFKKIKEHFITHGLDIYGRNSQKIIPGKIDYDLYGSKDFFEWLRDFNPSKEKDVWYYRDIYDSLPYLLAKVVNEIYKIFDINIHNANPVLPKERVKKLRPLDEPIMDQITAQMVEQQN